MPGNLTVTTTRPNALSLWCDRMNRVANRAEAHPVLGRLLPAWSGVSAAALFLLGLVVL